MQEVVNQKRGVMTVIGCGGTGINIATLLEKYSERASENFAQMQIFKVDTSLANMHGQSRDNFYHIKNADGSARSSEQELDGSGQKRDENAAHIKAAVPEILLKCKPGDITVVLSSGGGGSGSVVSPILTAELKRRGKNVISIVVGSRDTMKDIDNTIKTMKSFAQISKNSESPTIVGYEENGSVTNGQVMSQRDVDQRVIQLISALSVLFSRQNSSLDSKDLEHWLNFQKVTEFSARMVGIHVLDRESSKNFKDQIISVATLFTENSGTALSDVIPAYQCRAQLTSDLNELFENSNNRLPLHYVLSDSVITKQIADLMQKFEDLRENARASSSMLSILDSNDVADEDGIIF